MGVNQTPTPSSGGSGELPRSPAIRTVGDGELLATGTSSGATSATDGEAPVGGTSLGALRPQPAEVRGLVPGSSEVWCGQEYQASVSDRLSVGSGAEFGRLRHLERLHG